MCLSTAYFDQGSSSKDSPENADLRRPYRGTVTDQGNQIGIKKEQSTTKPLLFLYAFLHLYEAPKCRFLLIDS